MKRALLAAWLLAAPGARAEDDTPTRVKALEARLFAGALAEAEEGAQRVLEREPGNVEALLIISRARRWSGRLRGAREAADRAVALAPGRPDAAEELAWTYADAGRGRAAEEALGRHRAGPQLGDALTKLRRPVVTLGATAADDSNGVTRLAPRLAVDFSLPLDARLRVGLGLSDLTHLEGARVRHPLGGLALEVPLGPARLSGGWAAHRDVGGMLHEGYASLGLEPVDGWGLEVGARRRPFLEAAPTLSADEASFHGAGAGGATRLDAVARRGVDEVKLALRGKLASFGYLYAEGRAFEVSDGNRGANLAAGVGADVLAALGVRSPLAVTLVWDTYVAGFAEAREAYFSAPLLDAHSPGLALRWRISDSVQLSAEGGRTFALLTGANPGWFGGGGATLTVGRVKTSLRAQVREDPWFRSRRAWLAMEFPL